MIKLQLPAKWPNYVELKEFASIKQGIFGTKSEHSSHLHAHIDGRKLELSTKLHSDNDFLILLHTELAFFILLSVLIIYYQTNCLLCMIQIQFLISYVLLFVQITGNDSDASVVQQPPLVLFRQFVVAMLVLDTWQYFMHRYMHHNKFLYRHIHSQHHRLVVPYSFGALYNHPVEGLLLDTIGGALSFLLSGMSPRMSIFFFSFATIKTVDDHCGLWLPGNLFHFFFRNNSAYHDIHHQLYGTKYNYSQPFFVMWDRMLGTYMPYSLEKRAGGGLEAKPAKDCKDQW